MESQVKLKLQKMGNRILAASRNELYLSMRFLDGPFHELPYEMNFKTFYMATDGEHIFYHPRFLMERYAYDRIQVNRTYLHSVFHCLFRHLYHGEGKEREYWHLACDIAVEAVLDRLTVKAVMCFVPDEKEQVYTMLDEKLKVLTAEGIYYTLMEQNPRASDLIRWSALFLSDDHCFWDGKKQNKQQEKVWQNISEKVKTGIAVFGKGIGAERAGLEKLFRLENREKTDYRQFLRRFAAIGEEMALDLDSFDYGYYYYGMERYKNMPLLEEVEYKESVKIKEFAIAIDTSGSCSGQLAQEFLTRTFDLLKETESFFQKVQIHIIQCDQEIQEDTVITSEEELSRFLSLPMKGFGGTDFRPVFSYVDQLMEKGVFRHLKGLLYFTDGYGIYPVKRPPYDTVFLFPGDFELEPDVPPWAMKVFLNDRERYGF